MPVIYKLSNPEGQKLAVWEITEDEHSLSGNLNLRAAENKILKGFTNQTRRLQWLAVRSLLSEFYSLRPIIDYEENGKPFLINHHDHISISHSGKYAAVILDGTRATGIDIEEINVRILKIRERFTNELEKSYLNDERLIEQLTIIWAAKEVLFKMLHWSGVSFKENFWVEPFTPSNAGRISTIIKKDGRSTSKSMEYRKINNYVLVYPVSIS